MATPHRVNLHQSQQQELEVLWSSNRKNADKRVRFDPVFFPFDAALEIEDSTICKEATPAPPPQRQPEFKSPSPPKPVARTSQAQPVPGLLFGIRPVAEPATATVASFSTRKRKVDELFFAKRPNFKPRFSQPSAKRLVFEETQQQQPEVVVDNKRLRLSLLLETEREKSLEFDRKLETMIKQ